MRFIKGFWIVMVVSVALLLYAIAGPNTYYDPLKTYQYSLTRDELKERMMNTFRSKSNLSFQLTDSTGTDQSDFNYYGEVRIEIGTKQFEYHIKLSKHNSYWDEDIKSEISLIGAFDKVNGTGGFKTDDPDMEKLIGIFEKELIDEISADRPVPFTSPQKSLPGLCGKL